LGLLPGETRDSVEKSNKQRPIRTMASKPETKPKPAIAPNAAAKKPARHVMTVAKKPAATTARTATPKAAPKAARVVAPKKAETVTLKTLFEQLAEVQDMTKKQALAIATGMVDLVTSVLKAGDRVRMNGLGILEVKDRPARMGRNPATGATVQIAASKKVAFRVAKELKRAV
jgi:DNA-binding protein HU-beta